MSSLPLHVGGVAIELLSTGAGVLSLLGLVSGRVLEMIESPTKWAVDWGVLAYVVLLVVISLGHLGRLVGGSLDR
jgi:hypothetical protein